MKKEREPRPGSHPEVKSGTTDRRSRIKLTQAKRQGQKHAFELEQSQDFSPIGSNLGRFWASRG